MDDLRQQVGVECQRIQTGDNRLALVGGRCGELENAQRTPVQKHKIGKGSAHINAHKGPIMGPIKSMVACVRRVRCLLHIAL